MNEAFNLYFTVPLADALAYVIADKATPTMY